MNFDEAEAKFRELQTRVQRGEPISRAEYEDQVSQLAVQDDRGNLWEINPRTGKWMRFDGAEWIADTPPGRDQSQAAAPLGRASFSPPVQPSSTSPSTSSSIGLSSPAGSSSPSSHSSSPSMPPSGARPNPSSPPPATFSRTPLSGARPVTPSGSNLGGSGGTSSGQRPPGSPEDDSIQPYVRVNAPEQSSAAPPSGTGGTPPGAPMPPRVLRPSPPNAGPLGGPNREWVPLAIGAVVLLFCAILLFFGGRFALSAMGTQVTPTVRAAAVIPTTTVMPTAIKLSTQPAATAVATTVTAKVNEKSVNVRAQPNTKAKVLTTVKLDTELPLLGKNDAGDWYQITAPGTQTLAWIFAQTVDVVSGDPASLPVVSETTTTSPTKAPTAKPRATATKAP